MKKFIRTLALVLTLVFALSTVAFSAFAAEFEDYYEVPEYIFGDTDFDGRVTVRDATAIQKFLAKLIELSEDAQYFADVNGSGDITISDATTIQKYVASIIDFFPVEEGIFSEYVCTTDGEAIEVAFPATDAAFIHFTVDAEGYYSFTATPVEGEYLSFYIFSESHDGAWFSENDGESAYALAKLQPGEYSIYMSTMGESDVVASFAISESDFEVPFDADAAVELKAGDKIDIKAGTEQMLFKVNAQEFADDEALYIYTEGENPMVNMVCYDDAYILSSESFSLDDNDPNVMLYLYNNYQSQWYYIIVTQEEGGSDFTLFCKTSFEFFKESAEEIKSDSTYEFTVEDFSIEDEGQSYPYYAKEFVYKFTPEDSGYYSFTYDCEASMTLLAMVLDFEATEDEESAGFFRVTEGGAATDVQYFEAEKEYYIVGYAMTDMTATVKLTVKASDKEEYDKVRAEDEDFFDDATEDEIEYTEISLGDTVEVDLQLPDIYEKAYVFTAEEDATIVLYSEGSTDAYIDILDENKEYLYSGDDIPAYDSLDFAVIGTVTAGETIYMHLGTIGDDSDNYTFSIVNEADYTPLA